MNSSEPSSHREPASSHTGRFATTSWSLVVRATAGHSSESRVALESLCRTYWYPLYAFVRRRGNAPAIAEDLTQAFFVQLIEKDRLLSVDESRGKFRTFLLSALNNFLRNEWRKENAEKRGGDQMILSIDFEVGEKRYLSEPFHDLTAEKIFDRSWAMTLLAQTMDTLSEHYAAAGKSDLFEMLKPYLAGQGEIAYQELGQQVGMSEGAVKVAVHRMRAKCRDELRHQIGQTVESNEEIDGEIAELFSIVQN